jgi:Na+-translocating ferredoxin:NAD+ oxidoreductase RNF subunit RnfB
MPATHSALSRRQWITGFWRPAPPAGESKTRIPQAPVDPGPRVAVIQGRHCLAYRNLMCTSCIERCPEPEAIVLVDKMPRVNPSACTGCGDCHAVCPAPQNAVLMIANKDPQESLP